MKIWAVASIAVFLLGVSAAAQDPSVELARGLSNATAYPASTTDSRVVVSITANDELYVSNRLVLKNRLGGEIKDLLKRRDGNTIVYIAASHGVEYEKVVEVLNIIREQRVDQFGLIVDRGSASEILRGVFLIEVPTIRDPAEDLARLKPNPLMLMVSVSSELELNLNRNPGPRPGDLCFDEVPNGMGSEPDKLRKWLKCLFDHRTTQHAYKVGMETRTDLTAEQRTEKTVFINASRSIKYGDVLRVVDALKGAGTNPIGLKLDDLPN